MEVTNWRRLLASKLKEVESWTESWKVETRWWFHFNLLLLFWGNVPYFFHYYVSNVLVQPPTREGIQPSQWIHGRIVSGFWVLQSPSNRNKQIIDIIAHVGFLSLFRFGPTKTSWTHLRWNHHKSWGTWFQLLPAIVVGWWCSRTFCWVHSQRFFHFRHGHEIYLGSEIISLIFGHRYIQTHLLLGFQTTIPKDEDSRIFT